MPLRTTEDRDRRRDLRAAIDHTGYYPEVVADGVFSAAGGEEVVSYFVHHETTFDHEEVRRHLTALLLTPTRLVIAHTDEQHADISDAIAQLRDHDVTAQTLAEAHRWADEAVAALAPLPDGSVRKALTRFADTVVDRNG